MTVELGIILTLIACIIGILTYTHNRDKTIESNGKWQGSINAMLTNIQSDVKEIKESNITECKENNQRMVAIENILKEYGIRITILETREKEKSA